MILGSKKVVSLFQVTCASIVAYACLSACGKSDAKDILTSFVSDSDSQAAVASSAANEGVSNAISGESSSQAGVSLTSYEQNLTEASSPFSAATRDCAAASDGSVTVTITNTLPEKTETSTKNGKNATVVVSGKSTTTRKWTQTGTTLACDTVMKRVAAINWQATQLPSLAIDVNKERKTTVTFDKKGTQVVRTNDEKVVGKRTATWKSATLASNTLTLTKEVTSDVTRSFNITKTDGKQISAEAIFKTKDGEPLQVQIVREGTASRAIKSKTLTSGTLIATLAPKKGEASTGTAETTFTNLKFEYGTTGECSAKSGSFAVTMKDTAGAETEKITCEADANSTAQSLSCKNKAGEDVVVDAPKCSTSEEAQN